MSSFGVSMLEPEDLADLLKTAANSSASASPAYTGESEESEGEVASYQPGEYCVVDVRDDDFFGGNIRGAIHCASESFHSRETDSKGKALGGLARLHAMLTSPNSQADTGSAGSGVNTSGNAGGNSLRVRCKLFIFHCMMSQQRGPSCAEAFAMHCKRESETVGLQLQDLQIVVLRGGYRKWKHRYQGQSDLCENEN